MNGSGNAEITATDGRGDVDGEVQVLQRGGDDTSLQHEGIDVFGGIEMGEESSEEDLEIQTPKSRRRQVSQEDRERAMELTVADAHNQGLAAYDGFKIKKLYPKVYAKLSEYMTIKTHTPGMIDEETIMGILLYSPRIVLLDFFDTNKIYVNTDINLDMWYYKLDSLNHNVSSKAFNNRLEAETTGFYKAFEIFEQQLNT